MAGFLCRGIAARRHHGLFRRRRARTGARAADRRQAVFPLRQYWHQWDFRIDAAVPYRIGVSVWGGDDVTDRAMRGASAFRKAFKNYAGDPRAIILFTLSPWNLKSVRNVAAMCRDHDLPLTFNLYSPTATFLDKLRASHDNDNEFFRVSRPVTRPVFRRTI